MIIIFLNMFFFSLKKSLLLPSQSENEFSEKVSFIQRSALFYENMKEPYPNSLQYAEAKRLDICHVSENGGTGLSPNTRFWEGAAATTAEEEFSEDLHPPIPSHPGMKYPVRASPSLRYRSEGYARTGYFIPGCNGIGGSRFPILPPSSPPPPSLQKVGVW